MFTNQWHVSRVLWNDTLYLVWVRSWGGPKKQKAIEEQGLHEMNC